MRLYFLCLSIFFNTGFKKRLLGWDSRSLPSKAFPAIPLLAAVAVGAYLLFSCDSAAPTLTFFSPYKVCCVERISSGQTGHEAPAGSGEKSSAWRTERDQ